jgi:hypothetical protein
MGQSRGRKEIGRNSPLAKSNFAAGTGMAALKPLKHVQARNFSHYFVK